MATAEEYRAMGYSNYATKAWGDMPDIPETQRTPADYVAGYSVPGVSAETVAKQISQTVAAGTPQESAIVEAVVAGSDTMANGYDMGAELGGTVTAAMPGVGILAGANPTGTMVAPSGDLPNLGGIGGGIAGLLSAIGIAIPEPITTILGLLGAGYVGYQALGGGEGEGLFGNNLLGGDSTMATSTTPVPLGGPGLAEPGKPYLLKEWHIAYPQGRIQYYLVQKPNSTGRKPTKYIMAYKTWNGSWTWWRVGGHSLAVIGKKLPSHRMITRLRRNLGKHSADARTILKITSPKSLRTPRRRR